MKKKNFCNPSRVYRVSRLLRQRPGYDSIRFLLSAISRHGAAYKTNKNGFYTYDIIASVMRKILFHVLMVYLYEKWDFGFFSIITRTDIIINYIRYIDG